MRIPKYWRNTKDTFVRPSLTSASTRWITNLRTSRVVKDLQRRGRPFTTFTQQKVCLTSPSFTATFHVKNTRRWWFIVSHQQDQGARGSICLFGGTGEKRRHCHDLAQELPDLVQILDNHHEDHAKEFTIDYVMACLMHAMSRCKKK